MTDPASCLERIETSSGVFWPCVREHGHEGPHNPGRCNLPTHYEGHEYECSLMKGHAGPHRSWVEDADREADIERDYEREQERAFG